MKIAFLIADGMGDYPLEELKGKTHIVFLIGQKLIMNVVS